MLDAFNAKLWSKTTLERYQRLQTITMDEASTVEEILAAISNERPRDAGTNQDA